jgi:hypothetical protein
MIASPFGDGIRREDTRGGGTLAKNLLHGRNSACSLGRYNTFCILQNVKIVG